MNAFELLKQDHQTVSEIFDELEMGDAAARQQTFPRLKQELDAHAHVEETIFYPALKARPETRELVAEAYDEHAGVKELLASLEQGLGAADGDAWLEQLMDLRDSVEHHVEQEETTLFPHAEKALGREQIDALGARMQDEKGRRQQQQSKSATGARGVL